MITLLSADYDDPGEWLASSQHETVPDAVVHRYAVAGGALLVTMWKDLVHEVIHQTPCTDPAQSLARNTALFAHYGDDQIWVEIMDNGFGKSYRRADGKRFALWSYAMDYNTFGTMEFHAVRWG